VWDQGRITPRPFVLRCSPPLLPAAGPSCPAAFAGSPTNRCPRRVDGRRRAGGGRLVVSDKAVSTATLLPTGDSVRIRRIAGWVPSRAADNLFWLGRYLERAEATLRLLRALGTQREPGKGRQPRFTRLSESSGFW